MKTTIEVNVALLHRAKQFPASKGITPKQLFESGLRAEFLRQEQLSYSLPDHSFGGKGLQPEIEEGNWEAVQDLIYSGRGS